MLIAILVLLYGLTAAFDYLPGRKQRTLYENGLYLVFMLLSFSVLILYTLHINVPNPTGPIQDIVKGITGIFTGK